MMHTKNVAAPPTLGGICSKSWVFISDILIYELFCLVHGENGKGSAYLESFEGTFPNCYRRKKGKNRCAFEPLAPVQGKGGVQRIEAQVPSDGFKDDPKGKDEHGKAQKAQPGVTHRDTKQELLP